MSGEDNELFRDMESLLGFCRRRADVRADLHAAEQDGFVRRLDPAGSGHARRWTLASALRPVYEQLERLADAAARLDSRNTALLEQRLRKEAWMLAALVAHVERCFARAYPSAERGGRQQVSDALTLTLPDELVERIAERAAVKVLAMLGADSARTARPYLTVAEAAEFLRCKPQRVYDLLSACRLARYRDGTRVLVSRAELDAYLTRDSRPSRIAPLLPPAVETRIESRVPSMRQT